MFNRSLLSKSLLDAVQHVQCSTSMLKTQELLNREKVMGLKEAVKEKPQEDNKDNKDNKDTAANKDKKNDKPDQSDVDVDINVSASKVKDKKKPVDKDEVDTTPEHEEDTNETFTYEQLKGMKVYYEGQEGNIIKVRGKNRVDILLDEEVVQFVPFSKVIVEK